MKRIIFLLIILLGLSSLMEGTAMADPPTTDPTPEPNITPVYPPREPDAPLEGVTASSIYSASAMDLALAMGVPSDDIVSASLGTSDPLGAGISNAALSYFPTAGNTFAILSSGQAASASTANNSGSLSYTLNGLNNEQGNDLTQLTLKLNVPANKNCLSLDFAFFSEEYPEFVGSIYNDAYTAEYGLTDLSIVNSELVAPWNFAFDAAGNIISVNTVVGMKSNTGTTYDGGTPLLQAKHLAHPNTTITIVFSVQDLGDSIYDSAIFLDNFRWLNDPQCLAGSASKPPLVLVHGWQGHVLDSDLKCDPNNTGQNPTQKKLEILHPNDILTVFDTNPYPEGALDALNYWAAMPGWLSEDYDVWIAQLKTGLTQGTPHLEDNGDCLRNQINYVYNTVNAGNPGKQQKIVIVAHSMGGLVSRACLAHSDCSNKVDKLITLGSPHAGLTPADLGNLIVPNLPFGSEHFAGGLDMDEGKINGLFGFNSWHPNKNSIDYFFIGGWHHAPLWRDHDDVVGKYSSVGWHWPNKWFDPFWWEDASPPQQYWTKDESHSDYMRYLLVNGQVTTQRSYAYQCFSKWLKGESIPGVCENANGVTPTLVTQDITTPQTTEFLTGNLNAGQSVTPMLQIDTNGGSEIRLSWNNGNLSFSLIRPDGQVINPTYAASHPAEVSYETNPNNTEALAYATYRFTSTMPGLWGLNITANTANSGGANYLAYAILETNRTLTAVSNRNHYIIGQTATFTATLQNNGIGLTGATVTAKLARPDGVTDTLTLVDQGNGSYVNTYPIPNTPGFLPVAITAIGTDNGTSFTRRIDLLPTIAPNNAQLTGVYSIQPRNDNGDSLYEALNLLAQISVATPGNYTIFASLKAGQQLVTQNAFDVSLAAGIQTVTLPFDVKEIRAAKLNGPYTITDIALIPADVGVIAQTAENVLTTQAYNWQSFGGCYTLTTGMHPSTGGVINKTPAPNCNGGTQYSVDTMVQLKAVANSDLAFINWIVDASGTQNPTNVVISENKLVVANFGGITKIYLPLILK